MATSKGKVLMLPMGLGIGGAETHVISLSKSLRSLGWNILVASSGGERVKELTEFGIPHFDAPLNSRLPTDMLKAYKIISRIVDTHDIDIIHAHARIPIWISEKVASKKGIPLVATYHGQFRAGFPWMFFTKPGDKTIAVSAAVKQYIVEKFKFHPDSIVVIPNGIDVALFHPVSQDEKCKACSLLNIPPHRGPIISYVSRIEGDLAEAAVTAQEAVFRLFHDYPNVMLLIAGDGPKLSSVRSKADEINAKCQKEVVRPLGFVLDTPTLYAASDIVLGMSRVALESMASGKPVVIFGPNGTFGPISEDIIDSLEERNYICIDAPFPSTPDVLSAFIEDLLSNPEKMDSVSRLGRQVVLERHSDESVAKSTEQVYCELIDCK